ncbi:XRE family transcriptional regulator [Salipiger marinus]|uniref:XRE family transcriptional regulator n=1 Tax=Salipiger marinus TaxID=555512 RepID=UPI002CD97590|nr:S24 family peptidase [Salipiger manganoxidans]MEB3417588.1 S24 family peptidase [Salipiger manganoxidans]
MGRQPISKTPFAERLTSVRSALGAKDRKSFAKILGMNAETLGGYERGDTEPDQAFLARYKQDFSVNLNWLLTGDGEMFQGQGGGAQPEVLSSPPEANQSDMIRLPVYDEVYASAGHGALPISERADGVMAFERRFLRDQGATPEQCSLIWARGTSMRPTIPDGSILVVDHSQRSVEHGCIYVFSVSDRLVVKRARWRMDGHLELVSDNTAEGYPVEAFGPETADDLHVVGRVVYFCRAP